MWYAITTDGREGSPLPAVWARELVNYYDFLGRPWTWRSVPPPKRPTFAPTEPGGRAIRACRARIRARIEAGR